MSNWDDQDLFKYLQIDDLVNLESDGSLNPEEEAIPFPPIMNLHDSQGCTMEYDLNKVTNVEGQLMHQLPQVEGEPFYLVVEPTHMQKENNLSAVVDEGALTCDNSTENIIFTLDTSSSLYHGDQDTVSDTTPVQSVQPQTQFSVDLEPDFFMQDSRVNLENYLYEDSSSEGASVPQMLGAGSAAAGGAADVAPSCPTAGVELLNMAPSCPTAGVELLNVVPSCPTAGVELLNQPDTREASLPKPKRGRKRKSESEASSSRKSCQKKPKVYELAPLEDEEEEKKRKNAVNARRHRVLNKEKMDMMQQSLDLVTRERDILRQQVEMLKQKLLLQQLI